MKRCYKPLVDKDLGLIITPCAGLLHKMDIPPAMTTTIFSFEIFYICDKHLKETIESCKRRVDEKTKIIEVLKKEIQKPGVKIYLETEEWLLSCAIETLNKWLEEFGGSSKNET